MIVASAILLISVVSVGAELGTQFLSISTSTNQQAAAGLLNQAMEEVRALPYTFVTTGLSLADTTVTSDTVNILVSGQTCKTNNTHIWPQQEVIPCAATQVQAPFNPHVSTQPIDGVTYSVAAYPSIDATDTGSGPNVYRVTIIVSWHSTQAGPTQVSAQTLVYSAASGCLTQTNHPFAAPCQPFLYAGGSSGGGYINVTPDASTGNTPISGDPFNSIELMLATASTSEEIEQVSSITGSAQTSGGAINATQSQSTGSVAGTASADNDPGTARNMSSSASVSQSASTIQAAGSGSNANWISTSPGTADSGSSTATASASTSPACNDLAGTAQMTGLPCGSSNAALTGSTASLLMGLFAQGVSLGTATIASVAAQPFSNESFVGRYASSGSSYCGSTSGDGCVHAGAQESFGTIELAGLPAQFITDGAAPPSWGAGQAHCPGGNYLLGVTSFSASVSSESGINAANPSVNVPMTGGATPYLCYWTSTGYVAVPITWGVSTPSVTFPTVNATDSNVSTGTVTVSITPELQLNPTAATTNLPSQCASVCSSSASVPSPVQGDLIYEVTQGSTTLADLDIHVNLGNLAVNTSYQAAP
ncbi:MAG TPA: hypothetical protein VMV14_01320 [Acidimicrobiales bacterium]|nr:hypothetical protein [Acidimicrobiales bacterium]